MENAIFVQPEDLAARIPNGSMIAIPPDYCGPPMAAARAIVCRGLRDIHLVTVPASGMAADMLIGAGCVSVLETAAITMGEFGLAPRFSAAVKSGSIQLLDATCPAIHAALQASEKGIPFMPLRGLLGSDIAARRPDWKTIDNPFRPEDGPADPIVLLPAIKPDFALFHAPLADRDGNIWIGRRRELMTMAHAAAATIVTVEAVSDSNLLESDETAAGTIPSLYVDSVAEARRGCWPFAFGDYDTDADHVATYMKMAATEEGFLSYLHQFVLNPDAAAAE